MTKQEILNTVKDFSNDFPGEALMKIQANRDDFIPELLESLDYAYNNATELHDNNSDYFLHTYAMYLLAEFRETRAFPLLVNLLRIPEGEIEFILGDSLTGCFPRLLLCTFDNENLQMLLDVIENTELYEWARLTAVEAYGLLIIEGFVSREEAVPYLRKLIYDKLPHSDSDVVFTAIVGCIIDAKLFDMIPDARFLYENDRVDESVHGEYDGFIDWLFNDKDPKRTFIDNAISEMEWWACYKNEQDDKPKRSDDSLEDMLGKLKKTIGQEKQINQKPKKLGRNDPCPCGSGKKYKKCCIDEPQNSTSVARIEDRYDLLKWYPKNSAMFEQMYDNEAVDIDVLVYKALHRRSIPIWEKRDMEQERTGKIDYLGEALDLFWAKCEREKITSFSMYDEQYMVHYPSVEWIYGIIRLVEEGDSENRKRIKQKAEHVLKMFT